MSDDLHGTGSPAAPVNDFQQLIELARGYWRSRIVLTAVELDLFASLGDDVLQPRPLAERLDADVRGVELLANALVGMGLLHREENGYSCSRAASRWLGPDSDEYRGKVLRMLANLWGPWSRLTGIVRHGHDAAGEDDPRSLVDFTLAMHQGKPDAGRALVDELDLHGVARAVDVGGGPGTFAEAIARSLPEAQVVLVDRPEVIEVARDRLPDDLLEEGRLVLTARDVVRDGLPLAGDPPAPYDLALISSVLHLYGPEENAALLGSVYENLEPGGRIVIREFLVDETGTSPEEAAVFAVNMLATTAAGRCYAFEEIRDWLHTAGFGEVERRPFEGAIGLVTARRA